MPKFDYYAWQWFFYVPLLMIPIFKALNKKTNPMIALSVFYFFGWGIVRCYFEELSKNHNPLAALVLEVYGNNFLFSLTLFVIAFLLLNPKAETIKKCFSFVCVLNTALTLSRIFFTMKFWGIPFLRMPLMHYFIHRDNLHYSFGELLTPLPVFSYFFNHDIWWRGLIANPSMNAILTALLLPFLRKKWVIPLSILAVISSYSATALLILTFFAVYLLYSAYGKRAILGIVTILALSTSGFLYVRGLYSIFLSGRLLVWQKSMDYFFHQDARTILFGFGPSSFFVYGPLIQKAFIPVMPERDVWVMMHSDFLQCAFEFGILGCILMLIVSIYTLKKALVEKSVFLSLCAYFIAMTNYYPIHWPSHLIVLLFLLLLVFSSSNDSQLKVLKPDAC